jgi:sigma-E factor negative regulatory protein RseC
MLLESAHVIAVDDSSVWVETIRKSTCGTCAAQKGCGHGILNKISSSKRNYLQVFSGKLKASHCSVDDHVRISIPERVIIRGSLVVYMLPLVLMLLGATGATTLFAGNPDLLAVAGALAGFVVGFGLVRWHAWRHRSDKSMQPTLVDFVDPLVEFITVA